MTIVKNYDFHVAALLYLIVILLKNQIFLKRTAIKNAIVPKEVCLYSLILLNFIMRVMRCDDLASMKFSNTQRLSFDNCNGIAFNAFKLHCIQSRKWPSNNPLILRKRARHPRLEPIILLVC